jgi:hypothetical protein
MILQSDREGYDKKTEKFHGYADVSWAIIDVGERIQLEIGVMKPSRMIKYMDHDHSPSRQPYRELILIQRGVISATGG